MALPQEYGYKLKSRERHETSDTADGTYTYDELLGMTTFQLKNICYKEKLVVGLLNPLDRDGLIRIILKYRGADQRLLIRGHVPGGFRRVEETVHKYLTTPRMDQGHLHVPARITLYEGLRVDAMDRYQVEATVEVAESNVLIVNEAMELCGILHLVNGERPGLFWLTACREAEFRRTANKSFSLLFFRKQDSDYLYKAYNQDKPLPPANLHYWKVPVTDLEIVQLETTDAVLAIDFGSSNTTAGAYLDLNYVASPCGNDLLNGRVQLAAINFVLFPGAAHRQTEWSELLPTAMSVADCSDPNQVKYLFGSEAQAAVKRNGYSGQATVFYNLKRWVNGYDKVEEVSDNQGYTAYVRRSEILRAFILYVIDMAEHQFKCRFKHLHISSPVKLKPQFIAMFSEILPDYHIEAEHALDEGMAVLYNTIANQIERNHFIDGEDYQALVIDCGGGTTDLTSCRFRVEDSFISYKVEIHTSYENGDTNFGGSNLTYRILQYMKIVFASYYAADSLHVDIDELIEIPGADIFRHVDDYGVQAVYEKLETHYLDAETIIPTRFKEYENRSQEDYVRARSNFYFLWDIAEAMKKEFFRKTGILRNRFNAGHTGERDNDLRIMEIDHWCLSTVENGYWKEMHEFPDVVFNIQEINHLIKADIYEIVRKFLEPFYESGKLHEFSIIKLTGQSCRIDVFREALKEFIPGRSIEFRQKSGETDRVPDLKLACLRGAIRYMTAVKTGAIVAHITNRTAAVPYFISASTHNRQEKTLINGNERLNQVLGSISRPIAAGEVEFLLKDSQGNIRHRYVYQNAASGYKPALYEEIAKANDGRIPQEETDCIVNGESKFFVYAEDGSWGFHVVPVARNDEQLYMGQRKFFAFETDLAELDLFNGLK